MAQDFERNIARNVGTSEVVLRTANSDDALIGINIANVTTTQILMDVYITGAGATDDYYIVKDAPIPVGSSSCMMLCKTLLISFIEKAYSINSSISSRSISSNPFSSRD